MHGGRAERRIIRTIQTRWFKVLTCHGPCSKGERGSRLCLIGRNGRGCDDEESVSSEVFKSADVFGNAVVVVR